MRLLVVRTGAFGDVLHALPAVAALRAAVPEAVIDWVVDPRWSPLLVNGHGEAPVVSGVRLAETKAWSAKPFARTTWRSLTNLRRGLRAERYELVVDMQGTLRSAAIARMTGCPRRAGFAEPREAAAAWLYTERVRRSGVHVVEQNTALLAAAAGVAIAPAAVTLPREAWADDWAAGELRGQPLCVLAPTAGWAAKQWPAERYAELAGALRERGFDVVVNAVRGDDPVAAAVVAGSGGAARLAVCNVAGLVALVRRAALVAGGDSGPVHLAAALGVPVTGLFGPTDPARNGPWPAGCGVVLRDAASVTSYKRSAVADAGLDRISVQQVLAAVPSPSPF